MPKYYLFHSSYEGTEITTEKRSTNEFMNYDGEFNSFQEAKERALELAKLSIDTFRNDLEKAKRDLQYVQKLKCSDIKVIK